MLLFALESCTEKEPEKDYLYVIKSTVVYTRDSMEVKNEPCYGQNNFILYDSVTILYHDKAVFHKCGAGLDFTKPDRLFLTPSDLTKIKIGELKNFLKARFNWKDIHDRLHGLQVMVIASATDTIKNPAYSILMDFKNRHPELTYLFVRKWTEEEQYTATAKLNKQPYNPHTIIWKTGFSDGSESTKLEPVKVIESTKKPKVENQKHIVKYFYPNMSSCGGALYGYYDGEELVKIDATYGGELGFSRKTIDYREGKIVRIRYIEHFPEPKYYEEKHQGQTIDLRKIKYCDKRIDIDFYPVEKMRTYMNNKRVKTVISREELDRLIDCSKQMELELETEKIIEKPNSL